MKPPSENSSMNFNNAGRIVARSDWKGAAARSFPHIWKDVESSWISMRKRNAGWFC